MKKADLISGIAEKSGLTKVDSQKALNAFLEVVKETVAKGENVSLVGFGTFTTVERKARTGEIKIQNGNVQICRTYTTPAKRVVKFKVGKGFATIV